MTSHWLLIQISYLDRGDLVCELIGIITPEEEAKKKQLYDEKNGLKNSYMLRLQSEEVS